MAEPQTFGRYRVTRALGSGAMGQVFEAVDDVLGREVAIKTLRPVHGAIVVDDRFRTEARAIAQLSHPNVVQVFDIDLSVEPPYLVMERVAGPTLSKRLDDGVLAADELVPLGIQLARALAAAHAAGIVHRDVKPSNILAAGAGLWKLADFGVAHVPGAEHTMTGQFVGSPAYAPPEALVKGVVAPSGDVYGLGASLYQAAAGRWPRLDANGAVLAPVPPLRELAPSVPPAIAAAIDRAVAFEPAQRPSASELADLLAGSSGERPVVAGAGIARWKLWAVGSGIALVVLAVIFSGGKRDAPLVPPGEAPSGLHQIQDSHELHDWTKVTDEVQKGHYDEARHKLDDYERAWGPTEDSRQLRDQLPDEGDEPPGPPGGPPGKRKKHGHGD